MPLVLVPDFVMEELSHAAARVAPEIELAPFSEDSPAVERLADAEAVIRWYGGRRYSDLVEHGHRVRWLHTFSAGVDHVLTPAVRAKPNLVVTDSGPAFGPAISEFVLAWMLMVARRLPELLDRQHKHQWEWVKQRELCGATVGIIGLGPIGSAVAARSKAFGMRVLGLRRSAGAVEHVDEVLTGPTGLERLVAESDYIVMAAALTAETRGLIGRREISRMRHDAWIINIGRGAAIDEPALTEALRDGRIGGACLDVFAEEPLPHESPLWDLPNVFVSPHNSSGGTDGLYRRSMEIVVENMRRFTAGEPLDNIVDIARGY
jgi:phosphoglycerate dehydrogenase-like enzyme